MVMLELKVSERRALKTISQIRSTQRYEVRPNPEQKMLEKLVIELATEYGRYGYRQVTNLLNQEGWEVGPDRVYSIWRREGLKVPQKQPNRSRLWLADGSCVRHRPKYRNHVWSYDFVSEQTHEVRKFKILNVIDEYTRECIASFVARRIRSQDVILVLADLFLQRGCPKYIRSDNGPEFIAKKLQHWLNDLKVKPLFIQPGSPCENGYCESFNGKMRYELLNGEIFYSLFEAKVIIEKWRKHYNGKRPHSSLGRKPPAPEIFQPSFKQLEKVLLTM
jgi:putative transposase